MQNLKPLAQQVIVITGASSGIGLVTAKAAAANGARVLLVARGEAALAQAVREIEEKGGEAAYAVADVGDPAAVRAGAQVALGRWGQVDTWVNNAGTTIYAKLAETPFAEHERMMRTNYFGVVNGCTTALEAIGEGPGAIVTVGSIAGDIPTPILGAYAATKHAVRGYVESLRIELTAEGRSVSVTLVKPSGIDTPIGQHAANHMPGEARVPPPVYDPELVAKAILDAAVHPRRDVTVGGLGRAQVLFGVHFPRLLDWFGGALIPMSYERKRAKTPGDALFSPQGGGRERSGVEWARRTSLYTALERQGPSALLVPLAAVGIAAAVLGRRRNRRRRW